MRWLCCFRKRETAQIQLHWVTVHTWNTIRLLGSGWVWPPHSWAWVRFWQEKCGPIHTRIHCIRLHYWTVCSPTFVPCGNCCLAQWENSIQKPKTHRAYIKTGHQNMMWRTRPIIHEGNSLKCENINKDNTDGQQDWVFCFSHECTKENCILDLKMVPISWMEIACLEHE